MGALTGYKVLDLSRVLAGPTCAQILGDLGADVIKVERPRMGDDTRHWGPPYMQRPEGGDSNEACYFQAANRNKRSVAIDMATPEGADLVRELVKECDVLVENFKTGSLEKLGLGYDTLSAINPRLVHCSITGYGHTGPRAHEPGYDFVIEGIGGFMSVTGERDDRPGGGPQKAGVAIADLMTGVYAVAAIEAALLAREKTGRGQHCDMALLDVQIAMIANLGQGYLATGDIPQRMGNDHLNIVPYQVFSAKDKQFVLACGNDSQFAALSKAIGMPELAADPNYATNPMRIKHRDELLKILADRFSEETAEHWSALLVKSKIPVGPINNFAEALDDAQVKARGMVVDRLAHPINPDFRFIADPINLSDTAVEYRRPPPLLGQDTASVLSEYLNIDAERLAQLHGAGVIQ
ncbi:Acetyl-CoA:oxalate CoA-transferase [Carnimonas sp. R-84981]|uniref:CaiB/BaiF CoA transferase family protein n=1 Tax=Carnimonas bestiolae TaxID=3402172 RepID=UPI003EDC56B6